MAQTLKEQILAILPKLSKDDLAAVHLMAGHLLGAATGGSNDGAGTVGQAVFNALSAALGLPISYQSFNLTSAAKQYDKKLPELLKFLNGSFEGWDKNKVTQEAFLRMLFGLLADDLKEREVTPSIGIMISNMSRMPEVFDSSFPLYRESGLGKVILKKFQ